MTKVKFALPPAAGKVTSLFHSKKDTPPVFNQPLNTSSCPHHRIARLLYSIFLSLLLIIAIPVITLKALTYSFIEDNRMMGFTFQTTRKSGEPGEAIIMAALPRMLYAVPAKLAIIAATVSICLAAAHLGFVGTDWNMGKRVHTITEQPRSIRANESKDTIIRLPSQHHVLSHHQRHPRPLRSSLHLRYPQEHLALS